MRSRLIASRRIRRDRSWTCRHRHCDCGQCGDSRTRSRAVGHDAGITGRHRLISGVAQGRQRSAGVPSALTDRAGTGASGQTATVKASAAPRATANDSKVKINLFDYWDSRDPNGSAKDAGKENVNYATGGTSRNEAAAAFYFNGKGKDWNGWTGGAETSPGIVKTNLTKAGADAVPQFSTMVTNKNNAQTDMTYLFTESE